MTASPPAGARARCRRWTRARTRACASARANSTSPDLSETLSKALRMNALRVAEARATADA